MSLSPRRKLGVALLVLSLLAAALIQWTTGEFVQITREDEPPINGRFFSTQMTVLRLTFGWRYAAPIAVCAALGFYLLVIPQRPARSRP
jgi:TRAP-type C4-dicarboxylate transport system permease small subunit